MESEEQFRAIFEGTKEGIIVAESKSKKFYLANDAICQMLGYGLEELKTLGVMDIHPKKDLPYVLDQFERQANGEFSLSRDLPIRRKDGSVFYADVNATTIKIAGKVYLIGFFHDVTERKKIEEENKKLLHDVDERCKELECMYGLSELVEKPGISLDELLQEMAGLLPRAYERPEIACARIGLAGKEFKTNNFKPSKWKQSADIKVYGIKKGFAEVYYFEGVPFLKEEDDMLKAVAERLGKITERKNSQEELKKRMGELELFQKLTVGREMKMIELKAKINELEVVISEPKEKTTELEAVIKELEAKILDLEARIAKPKVSITELKAKVKELKAEIAKPKAKVNELKAEIAKPKAKITELNAVIKNVK